MSSRHCQLQGQAVSASACSSGSYLLWWGGQYYCLTLAWWVLYCFGLHLLVLFCFQLFSRKDFPFLPGSALNHDPPVYASTSLVLQAWTTTPGQYLPLWDRSLPHFVGPTAIFSACPSPSGSLQHNTWLCVHHLFLWGENQDIKGKSSEYHFIFPYDIGHTLLLITFYITWNHMSYLEGPLGVNW
jgi:hypothetical protein